MPKPTDVCNKPLSFPSFFAGNAFIIKLLARNIQKKLAKKKNIIRFTENYTSSKSLVEKREITYFLNLDIHCQSLVKSGITWR